MKVKCINQGGFLNITLGYIYDVKVDKETSWSIIANNGNQQTYSKRYFEVVPELVVEDADEAGVIEESQPEFTVEWNEEDDNNITIEVNGNKVVLHYYQVASNCGVRSYHGVNYLYENCDENDTLFKDIIKAVIELVESQFDSCMLIFSTNSEYPEIWYILDDVMDFNSKTVENPNSDMDVKLWIKYTN